MLMQLPVPPSLLQPGQLQLLLHCEHVVAYGVPEQLATWNSIGGGGVIPSVPQQMRALGVVQSWSEEHDLGQVFWQTPPQQSGIDADPLQSVSLVQAFGQIVPCRQMPPLLRECSRPFAVVQQISPEPVSHCEVSVHDVGHSFAAVQIGVE
jgi:hypothetical protein